VWYVSKASHVHMGRWQWIRSGIVPTQMNDKTAAAPISARTTVVLERAKHSMRDLAAGLSELHQVCVV